MCTLVDRPRRKIEYQNLADVSKHTSLLENSPNYPLTKVLEILLTSKGELRHSYFVVTILATSIENHLYYVTVLLRILRVSDI